MEKSLKSKAIKIKGKDYVQVKDRIVYFNDTYPNGSIDTTLCVTSKYVRITAVVTPDVGNPARRFVGHSESARGGSGVDSTSAVENCETSAVGRALAMMGIGVLDGVASADEVYRAVDEPASQAQVSYISNIATNKGKLPDVFVKDAGYDIGTLTKRQASGLIRRYGQK
jgi:hypothetical protein